MQKFSLICGDFCYITLKSFIACGAIMQKTMTENS